jgi:hypothetical protein
MNSVPFLVSIFNKHSISLLIKECFGAQFPDISKKRQMIYLIDYLEKLGAKFVICEMNYVDKGFLADYQKYYATCFNDYSSKCARLHFFANEINPDADADIHDQITNLFTSSDKSLISDGIKNLQEGYLGFSVIKPLPVTFMGRTCLKRDDDEYSHFLTKGHTANLFGIKLQVKTIAFQEQDKVVAACATTALWSMMHATKHLYCKSVPSPSEITLNAIGYEPLNINGFPNVGLSDEQVLRTLEVFKLRQHHLKIDTLNSSTQESLDFNDINNYIIDHLKSGIPLLAGTSIYLGKKDANYDYIGDHAVTVLGVCQNKDGKNALYLHDDRIGPYVKVEQIMGGFESDNSHMYTKNLKFHYQLEILNSGIIEKFTLENLKTCNYHKVRIPYTLINKACKSLKELMIDSIKSSIKSSIEKSTQDIGAKVSIDYHIRLCSSNELKATVLYSNTVYSKETVLVESWPNYIWNCSFYIKEADNEREHLFDFIFDTTDIPLGNELVAILKYHPSSDAIEVLLQKNYQARTASAETSHRSTDQIEDSFFFSILRAISEKPKDFFSCLDGLFGPLKPPSVIHNQEVQEGNLTKTDTTELIACGEDNSLQNIFVSKESPEKLIWVISKHGTLLIGIDNGHPTLIEGSPARIAGEVLPEKNGEFKLNARSGRYSRHYVADKQTQYLQNALGLFESIFKNEVFSLKTFNEK